MQEMQEILVRSLDEEDTLEEEMPTHCSILAGDSHGQRSLEGYSPEGHKELDMTEHAWTLFILPVVFYFLVGKADH